MPEEVKCLSPCPAVTQQEYKTEYSSESTDDCGRDSSYSDKDMNRSENSGSSDESSCYKQNGHETVEIIPTRTIKTSVPKPAANPLQFVKIGPCDLYRSAQQQLQKVSEVKKPKKEVKDEMEDWQSNLDSWKCNRRKQQEHIIERVVEVKKLELEEHDRNRKRTKTFSEMMEERTSKGRKLSLPLYLEEDSDDLSDLGISSSKNVIKSSTIPEENETKLEDGDDNVFDKQAEKTEREDNKNGKSEDTYESAIQGYENKMKSLSNGKVPTPRKYNTRRGSATKIEEKLSELEKIKNRSVSSTDLTESNKKQINIPKVNIFQRKEIFEKISNGDDSSKKKIGDDLPPVRSIKERLHSLEKQVEENASNKTKNTLVSEISVKDRLCHINEKMQRQNSAPVPEKSTKESCKQMKESYDTCNGTKEHTDDGSPTNQEYSSDRSCSSEDYDHVQMNHFHHRSLDSLQGHDSPNGFCFERVQSLECIDCCSNYPASVLSGDTDREDSGIHTADVSSSVSQADDFDLHADTSMDVDVKSPTSSANTDEMKVDKSSHNDFHFVSQSVNGPRNDGEVRDKDVNQNSEKDSQNEVFKSNERVGDLVDLNDGGEKIENRFVNEGENIEFSRSNQNADVQSDTNDGFASQNTSSLNETLVNIENNNVVQNDQFKRDGDEKEEISCLKREIKSEQSEHMDSNSSDVTRTNYDNGYENDSYKEEINSNNIQTNPSRHQNCYETDSSEYASDFAPNAAEQRIDYMYSRNNQYMGECPTTVSSKEDTLFAFESSTAGEPPKEKPPPPPPLENSDDELEINDKKNGLRRMDSTKRIKKELRQKRSSFLGIEGFDDDSYLEPELESVKPPPDMTTFLQEERRLEKLLYRQSICSESDSTQGESRDSGVELDKNQMDENSWIPESIHSRQDSETYANTSTTSEEDEIIKKEREILEILELEEQRHYETDSKSECNNLGEKLVLRLKELERQKSGPCWSHEEERLNNQRNLLNQQNYMKYEEPLNSEKPQYANVQRDVIKQKEPLLLQQQWTGRSLQDITQEDVVAPVSVEYNNIQPRTDYRSSMPNIQQELTVPNHYHRVPPPIPPNKPSAHFREPAVVSKVSSPQQMSKQTLQALSAVPRSKIVATDSWVLSKKKPRQEAYNYQHWLIQEAEHRRITEYQQRHRNDNVSHGNYVNTHPDYVEHGVVSNDVQNLENRVSHQNRSLYAHPQMLPYRNNNQYNHEKNYIKPQQKPLPDSVIQTITQRVQNRFSITDSNKQRRRDNVVTSNQQEKMLSVSGKKKCSHCGEELGRGAAMIIESLRLFYHIDCFKCCVCCVQLGDGLMGTDVRVRNDKLHCHSCYSNDEGLKFSCV